MGSSIVFFCMYCVFTSVSLTEHLKHRDSHRHINWNRFHCGVNRCEKVFNGEPMLRMHILRSHALRVSEMRSSRLPPSTNNKGQYTCPVGVCRKTFEIYKPFLSHLNFHLSLQCSVKCPYNQCHQLFHNEKSLSSHLSRKHSSSKRLVRSSQVFTSSTCSENEELPVADFIGNNDVPDIFVPQIVQNTKEDEAVLLRNLAQFCMKLEYHHIIPEKVIQYVFEEMSKVYSQGLNFLHKELRRQMELEDIPDDKIQRILCNALKNDPFSRINKDLHSTHTRKEFYKRTFNFVQPERIDFYRSVKCVDGSELRKKAFYYYVPVKKTLLACFEDKSLNLKLKPVVQRDDGLLCDVTDGLIFRENKLFQDHPLCIYIVVYQDGVEIVNPIGAARKKHKILAIYLSILNVPDHLRSHISSIKLVALCKEKDFVHEVVYGRIVEDLKDLERNGLNVPGIGNVKVGLVFVAGDNLGSHALGGFVENFSKAIYFCRYCHLDRPTFESKYGESVVFDLRTVKSYNECVELGKLKKCGHQGIKFDSIFNQLQYFHCCKPGLPCCLGHDLMEGCIAFDLKLFIDYFIAESWFSLHELNESIANFSYSTEERRDQPLPITEDSSKIRGGAWQIWTLLRLFPLIVQEYIYDDKHEVWQALIKLSEITEIVCSPSIHKSHLPFLQAIIDDYLTVRKTLFPDVRLRPKHHYLTHYPWLILLFGPLMKVWTLRFESKHTYFKRTARVIRNFRNILFSFAMKHELLQCYIRSGADLRCEVEVSGTCKLSICNYSKEIQDAVRVMSFNLCDIEDCVKVSVKGTEYIKGDIVVLTQHSYECGVQLGRIILILVDCDQNVHFLCEKLDTVFWPRQRLYVLGKSLGYLCVRQEALLSYYPVKSHCVSGYLLVKLKHAIVSTNIL